MKIKAHQGKRASMVQNLGFWIKDPSFQSALRFTLFSLFLLYELIPWTGLSRSSVHRALVELRALGLIVKDERTDKWAVV